MFFREYWILLWISYPCQPISHDLILFLTIIVNFIVQLSRFVHINKQIIYGVTARGKFRLEKLELNRNHFIYPASSLVSRIAAVKSSSPGSTWPRFRMISLKTRTEACMIILIKKIEMNEIRRDEGSVVLSCKSFQDISKNTFFALNVSGL